MEKIRFLGSNSNINGCPSLYRTEYGYIAQGWPIAGHPDRVEIPHALLGHLEPGTCLGAPLTDTGHGTFTLRGEPVTDPEVLSQMDIPEWEYAVLVPVGIERRPGVATAGL